jgi:hypothetical protein
MGLTILSGVFQAEAFGQIEVKLNGAQLPLTP